MQVCIDAKDDLAPHQKKYTKENNMLFYEQILNLCSYEKNSVRKQFLNNSSESNRHTLSKQRNCHANLLRKIKRDNCANLKEKDVADNENF